MEMLMESLRVTGFGMTGIFVFMAIFFLIIVGLNKLFTPQNDKEGNA
jgi:Na+-transporting methylmalonyl-CoA/oxaloacetate decarboxylase gamma subunit